MSARLAFCLSSLLAGLALATPAAAQPSTTPFVRGDVNADADVNLTDAVFLLEGLFLDGPAPQCLDAADTDNDASVDLADALYLLNFLSREAPAPPFPFPACGVDPAGVPGCFLHGPCAASGRGVPFFGAEFPTDLVVFVVDRSGSQQNEGELDVSKGQVIRALVSLRAGMQFAVVFFDRDALTFPRDPTPLVASAPLVVSARRWVLGVPGGSGTCPLAGLRAALEFAANATVGRKAIFYVSDGGATCQGAADEETHSDVLAWIVEENVEGIPVHVFELASGGGVFEEYLRSLARVTGGVYTAVPF